MNIKLNHIKNCLPRKKSVVEMTGREKCFVGRCLGLKKRMTSLGCPSHSASSRKNTTTARGCPRWREGSVPMVHWCIPTVPDGAQGLRCVPGPITDDGLGLRSVVGEDYRDGDVLRGLEDVIGDQTTVRREGPCACRQAQATVRWGQ